MQLEDLKILLTIIKTAREGNEGKYKETAVETVDLKRLRAATRPQNTMLTFFSKGDKGGGVAKKSSIFGSSSSSSSTNKSTKAKPKAGGGAGKKRKNRGTGAAGQTRLAFKK